ncbi:phosphoribosyl-ATP diphosphatase [Starkeya koreensis]|uniref:phosphoribosyl-ATP diphosphatase n=1 Tax=Ancylobacter koreensis TaxID=266121 RepID=A0ABT0DKY8_9HYPH|nr:phosphoribosyl-ATP diphosphatase [Ancylobacter koreensis]MCK0207864.1 phosphoribosyl-ATP diphosphatase [Ancylobacter koreensis]
MSDSIRRLHAAVIATRKGQNPSPRTERLFRKGRATIAKKVAEEAVEVALDGVMGDRAATVRESADLVYNLVVLWAELGIAPDDVWAEMDRRERLLGIAEKLPKRQLRPARDGVPDAHSRQAPALLWDIADGAEEPSGRVGRRRR